MTNRARVHIVAGGFPPGMPAGHDHDYARSRLLDWMMKRDEPTTMGNDFNDIDRWLPGSKLMVSYVAGPFLNEQMNEYVKDWLEHGGHWLAFHGTSGGKAVRVDTNAEGRPRRAMLKQPHHATLGGFFLNHPPIRKFSVDVRDSGHPITKGVGGTFEVMDEPYMIEVQEPEKTEILLTAELGPDASPEGFGFVYEKDTALMEDGKTRAMGYTKPVGQGSVTYFALGHCHTPNSNVQPFVEENVSADKKTPMLFRGPWIVPEFEKLVENSIDYALGF